MAIRTVLLGGDDWSDGEVLFATDQNDTFNATVNLTPETTLLLDDVVSNSATYELKKTITVTLPVGVYRQILFNIENITTVSNQTGTIAITKNSTSPGTSNDSGFAYLRATDGTAIGSSIGTYSANCSVVVGNGDIIRVYQKKTGANQCYGMDVFMTKTKDTDVALS